MTPPLLSWVRSVAIATMATSLMLAALIVAAEAIPALKNWLKATFYHHWLGKGALALGLFVAVSIFARRGTMSQSGVIALEAVLVTLSVVIIAGFFLLHLLKFV